MSFSIASATTFGLTAGLVTSDLFGFLSAEVKATVSGTMANTFGGSESVRTFITFGSGSDIHKVVFQGTLSHAYLYVGIRAADLSALVTIASINVPVATNERK